jgi:hypothetical protein
MTGYLLSKLPPVKLVQILNAGSSTLSDTHLTSFSSRHLEYSNIRAYALVPGVVPTDMLLDIFKSSALDKRMSLTMLPFRSICLFQTLL